MVETDTSPVLGTTKGDLEKLLEHVQLLGTDEDRQKLNGKEVKKWDGETPLSFQIIKSGATQVTRTWTKWARNAGGTVGLLSVIGGGSAALSRASTFRSLPRWWPEAPCSSHRSRSASR
jgi:hypothetical protein